MAASRESILSTLTSLFFPSSCVHCGRPGSRLCAACKKQLRPIGAHACRCCGKPTLYEVSDCSECRPRRLRFKSAAAAFAYEGPARSLVHALKYSGQRRLAELMADLTLESYSGIGKPEGDPMSGIPMASSGLSVNAGQMAAPAKDRHETTPAAGLTAICKAATLTYVPLHKPKQSSRGYNQARLYARALARRLEVPCQALLVKRRPTPPQNRLNFSQRRNNLVGCFSALQREYQGPAGGPGGRRRLRAGARLGDSLRGYHDHYHKGLHGGRVVLVDDVYTTGSTASECARVLKEDLGVEVLVWTFARTVRNWSIGVPGPMR